MKTWSLTALAADFEFPYRTLMRWRKPPLSISPSVRIPGKTRAEFSKADVALFLTARRGFAANLLAADVKGLLDFLREHEIMNSIFSQDERFSAWFRNKFYNSKDGGSLLLVIPLRDDPIQRQRINERQKAVGSDPLGKDEPLIISSAAIGAGEFQNIFRLVQRYQWQHALIDLDGIVRELDGRLDAIAHSRDYKETVDDQNRELADALANLKTPGQMVARALSGYVSTKKN